MKRITLLIAPFALVVLEGCAADQYSTLDTPDFGNSVRQNIASETVNPMAPVDRSAPLNMDGQRAALQQNKYTTDTVEKPMDVGTLTGAVGGGGGGGGGVGGGGLGVGPVR